MTQTNSAPVQDRSAVLSGNGTRPGTRLGRSAWMIFVVAQLTASGMLFYATRSSTPGEVADSLSVMGYTIGGIGYIWAITLALRALYRAERKLLPLLLLNLVTIPPAAFGVWRCGARWYG